MHIYLSMSDYIFSMFFSQTVTGHTANYMVYGLLYSLVLTVNIFLAQPFLILVLFCIKAEHAMGSRSMVRLIYMYWIKVWKFK